ncbi:hypothetical protein [Thermostaphylospora chromogena]|uniref:Uncharacterized protein n=1 Tax=Thermostaphylospora chromogena TaxID=35622 RepID=A0A1H1CPZ9_9ACTN|nr:hypothetical protein [Thermostaphylospora chromogena]SDQ66397.1 hypothetical protein SAMN04489764_1591 [Thermostaphylospora chromogena]
MVTPRDLLVRYGQTWIISPAISGGWYAIRRNGLSAEGLRHGLSGVRCGETVDELARHLAEEERLEKQWRGMT